MWWNIIPSFLIIAASVAMPHAIAPINHWLFVGHFFRRSLLERDLREQYLRDTRLTGNPYKLSGLDQIPDPTEEEKLEDEDYKAEVEYQKCKAQVEERALQEALDRTTKCPRPIIIDDEEEEELDKCKRRDALKKKRKLKRVVIETEEVDKEEKCRKSICDDFEPEPICKVPVQATPSVEDDNKSDDSKCAVRNDAGSSDDRVTREDDVNEKPKKCKKPSSVVVDDEPKEVTQEEDNITQVVETNDAPKKCKKTDVVTGDVQKKCRKKETVSLISDTDVSNNESNDADVVVEDDYKKPKKCRKKDEDIIAIDDNKKCSSKEPKEK